MLKRNFSGQMNMITFLISFAFLVNSIAGLSVDNQLSPVENSIFDQVNSVPDRANSEPVQLNQVQDKVNPEQGQINSVQDQINLVQNQINSEHENNLAPLANDNNIFDLSKDELVNTQSEMIEEDASLISLNKDSVDKETKLDSDILKPFLYSSNIQPNEGSVDLSNINYADYFYLMDNIEDALKGVEPNNKGYGIDDSFYAKPQGKFSNEQRLLAENINNFFDDKAVFDENLIANQHTRMSYIPSNNNAARVQIITFFEETPEESEQNPRLPYINDNNNEFKNEIYITKSRISLFVFGWMFMVTGIALSCFIVIVGRKAAASKKTLHVKKFASLGEQPYHSVRSEV